MLVIRVAANVLDLHVLADVLVSPVAENVLVPSGVWREGGHVLVKNTHCCCGAELVYSLLIKLQPVLRISCAYLCG